MNSFTISKEQQFYAKLAGLSYIVFTIAGLTKTFLLNMRLTPVDSLQLGGLFANEMHFRLGVAAETIMFLGVVMASVSFYMVLKPVNSGLSLTALCLRLVEIIIGGISAVFSMVMLAISSKSYLLEMFDLEQLRAIMLIVANVRMPASEYSWISMGFAGFITFYLFFRTRFIPRAWSVWGMITYSSLIIYPFAKILIPDLPREVMFVMFPGALFELGVGIWLCVKGIRLSANDTANAATLSVKA